MQPLEFNIHASASPTKLLALFHNGKRENRDPFPTGDWEPVNSTEQKPVTTLLSNYLLAWQNSPWKAQILLPPQFDAIMASYS